MAHELPRLRMNLDFMPSPDPEQPGLLIRDPFRFSDAMLLIPPELVASLACFDGRQTQLELRESLVRATGDVKVEQLESDLFQALSKAGFLENEDFDKLKNAKIRDFSAAPKREAAHAGTAYPQKPEEAGALLSQYMQGSPSYPEDSLIGIAAPHTSPFGGWESYRDAYAALRPEHADRTFVILGTSHYGAGNRFGLTRKPFVTPFGEARTAVDLVDWLWAGASDAIIMEDYCHAIEHSIEFQVLFLQHLYGPDVRILPILCGSFTRSIYEGGKPEDSNEVKRFIGTLGDMAASEGDRLMWTLGVDMAHMGRRYGDPQAARADADSMIEVAERDKLRIERVNAADGAGFWELVQENQDDLKWCGSAPIYTFLKAVPQARGQLHRYQQWNIDQESVVSFAAMSFHGS
jgi:AmmeMemoRadiSam system protein B